jgi:Fic family protein
MTSTVTLSERCKLLRAEYLEMPGLSLTAKQAQRLWHLDPANCSAVLSQLVASGFLREVRGLYIRGDVASTRRA